MSQEKTSDGPPSVKASEAKAGSISELRRGQELAERVSLLEQAPLFSVLRGEDMRDLADKFHSVRYRRAEVIFREGEPAERLFLIDDGTVKLSIASPSGQELLIGLLRRGHIFGELSIVDRGNREMDARAMDDTRLYTLASDVFWSIIEGRPALARRLLELMGRRLRRADQAAQDLVFFDAPTRLARKLLELGDEHGQPHSDGGIVVTTRVTQEEMAQMIGVSRESANRLISSFAGRGWIEWNDGRPILLKPESLMRRAR